MERVYDSIRDIAQNKQAYNEPKQFVIGHGLSLLVLSLYLFAILTPIFVFIAGLRWLW